jgi:hypothetical protein
MIYDLDDGPAYRTYCVTCFPWQGEPHVLAGKAEGRITWYQEQEKERENENDHDRAGDQAGV